MTLMWLLDRDLKLYQKVINTILGQKVILCILYDIKNLVIIIIIMSREEYYIIYNGAYINYTH